MRARSILSLISNTVPILAATKLEFQKNSECPSKLISVFISNVQEVPCWSTCLAEKQKNISRPWKHAHIARWAPLHCDFAINTFGNKEDDIMLKGECQLEHNQKYKKETENNRKTLLQKSDTTYSDIRPLFPQLTVVAGTYLISLSSGISQGHSAMLLPQLKSPNSTLPTDEEMASWIASVHVAVNPLGSIIGGFLMDWYGRRKTVITGILPCVLGWLLMAAARNHNMILIGRCLEGIGKGMVTISRMVYLDELTDPKIRGTMAGSATISFVLGVLIIYLLGGILDWRSGSWVAMLIPLAGFVAFLLLPETPVWLVRNKHDREAGRVLRWLWGKKLQHEAELELKDIQSRLSSLEKSNKRRMESLTTSHLTYWLRMFLAPHALKPFLIIHIFNLFQVFCGTQLTIFYAMDIVSGIVTDNENNFAYLTATLTAVTRLIFVIILCFLVYWIGRRPLAIFSGICSSLSTLILGTILYLQVKDDVPLISTETEKWISLGLILVYIGASTCGFFSLPFIMAGEVIPSAYRGIMCGYIFAVNDLVLFAVMKSYPWLMQNIFSHGLFWMFGISCLLCTVFVYLFLPETQGISLLLIEDYFRQGNTFWVTRKETRCRPLEDDTECDTQV